MKIHKREDLEKVKNELLQELLDETWLIDVVIGHDSGGATIDVVVNSDSYPENDPLPRMWNGVPFCVLKKPIIYFTSKDKLS